MANNITYKVLGPQSAGLPDNTTFKTIQQPDESHVQVVSVDGSQTITGAATGETGIRVFIGPTDPVSDIPVFMDFEHHQVHEGESHKIIDKKASLGTGTVKYSIDVGTFTPSIRSPHMLIGIDVYNGSASFDLYEAATYTGGTTKTSYNRNRNSATNPTTVIKTGVTSTNGTLIDSFFAAGGVRTGGNGRAQAEWLLKNNTTYRVDVIGLTAGTQAIVSFEWYEDLGV